jgi:hypothetical protein
MPEPNNVSTSCQEKCQTADSMWDSAISSASDDLAEAQRKVARLRCAIRIFREHKVKGVPWPGGPDDSLAPSRTE